MADTSAVPAARATGTSGPPVIEVEFCGDRTVVTTGGPFGLGGDADLVLDTPSSMPAELVRLETVHGIWFARQLAAGAEVSLLAVEHGLEARLEPGRAAPIVLASTTIRIATSRSRYEVDVRLTEAVFSPAARPPTVVPDLPAAERHEVSAFGAAPAVEVQLTAEQRVLVVVLAATVLRRGPMALSEIPSSVEAAAMLGWPVTKFNRKLDTVCGKLDRAGIPGLHGGDERPALNRRTRLVQEVVRHAIVGPADLALLEPYAAAWSAFGDEASATSDDDDAGGDAIELR